MRERHAFGAGELARNQNQVRVMRAIIDQLRTKGVSLLLQYDEILKIMEGNFETDLTPDQLSSLAKIAITNINDWEIKQYLPTGVSGKRTTASTPGTELFIIYPKFETVNFATRLFDLLASDRILTDEILAEAP